MLPQLAEQLVAARSLRIAVTSLAHPSLSASPLRRLAVLFDKVGVRLENIPIDGPAQRRDRDLLLERGIIADTAPLFRHRFQDTTALALGDAAYDTGHAVESALGDLIIKHGMNPEALLEQVLNKIPQVKAAIAGFDRALAAELRNTYQLNATAVLGDNNRPEVGPSPDSVLRVVLESFAFPSQDTSWDRIIAFREDPDVKAAVSRLWVWIHEMGSSGGSAPEISDRIRALLDEYEAHMRLHKLKATTGALETFITVSADILDDVSRLKFGAAARAVFSLKQREIQLLEAERGAPGREIALIAHARQKLE